MTIRVRRLHDKPDCRLASAVPVTALAVGMLMAGWLAGCAGFDPAAGVSAALGRHAGGRAESREAIATARRSPMDMPAWYRQLLGAEERQQTIVESRRLLERLEGAERRATVRGYW